MKITEVSQPLQLSEGVGQSSEFASEVSTRRNETAFAAKTLIATTPERIAVALQLLGHVYFYVSSNKDILIETIGEDFHDDPAKGKALFRQRLVDIEKLFLEVELELMGNPEEFTRKSFEKFSEVISLLILTQAWFEDMQNRHRDKEISSIEPVHPQANILFQMFRMVAEQLDSVRQAELLTPEKQQISDQIADFLIMLKAASQTLQQANALLLNDEDRARELIWDAAVRTREAFDHTFFRAVCSYMHHDIVKQIDRQLVGLESFFGVNILAERKVREAVDLFRNAGENAMLDFRDVVDVHRFLPRPVGNAGKQALHLFNGLTEKEIPVSPGFQAAV